MSFKLSEIYFDFKAAGARPDPKIQIKLGSHGDSAAKRNNTDTWPFRSNWEINEDKLGVLNETPGF